MPRDNHLQQPMPEHLAHVGVSAAAAAMMAVARAVSRVAAVSTRSTKQSYIHTSTYVRVNSEK